MKVHQTHLRDRAAYPANGFALITVLVISSLLVLLVLALLSLANQAQRTGGSNLRQAEAQANARLALAVALGELQRTAGPDQRVTATANIAATASGDALPAGAAPTNHLSVDGVNKGLAKVKPGTRHWTGVWRNNDRPADSFTKTPSPVLLKWLVSGNDGGLGVTPDSPALSLKADGSVADPDVAALMVGTASVGSASQNLDNYVAAPLVGIQTVEAGSRQTTGKFAWWAGDEGVKARLNLNPPYGKNSVANQATLASQRRGWESVAGWQKYPLPGDAGVATVQKVQTRPDASLVDPTFNAPATGATPPQRAYHAMTLDSRGVLADTLNGGLRLDLTAALSKDLPTANTAYDAAVRAVPNLPLKGGNIIPSIGGTNFSPGEGPKWDRLRQFIVDGTAAKANNRLETRSVTDYSDSAIAPLISEIRILLGMRMQPIAGSTTQFYTWTCAKVAVVLANPYSRPLRWTRDLDIELTIPHYGNTANARDLPYPTGDRPARIWDRQSQTAAYWGNPNGGEPGVLRNVRFRIAANQELPTGEARPYTMAARFERPVDDMAERIVPLVPLTVAVMPDDYNISLQMRKANPIDYTLGLPHDVREDWTTTLVNVTLRDGGTTGTTGILRHIASFELDNAPFIGTVRWIDGPLAKDPTANFTKDWAIPLQLYSFQFSRPGEAYENLLPTVADKGVRSSTVRGYMDFNVQATRIRKTLMAYNAMPYFMEIANSRAYLPFTEAPNSCGGAFLRNIMITPVAWGRAANSGIAKTILFSRAPDPASLAHFQHADLTADDIYGAVGHQPGYALGNSYATMFVKRELTKQRRNDYRIDGRSSMSTFTAYPRNYYDISHLLNNTLWDGFFLSTVPATGSTEPLNKRMFRRIPNDTSTELRDPAKAAQRLLADGALNINSTEKDAWKALLAGSKHLKLAADGSTSVTDAIFPRTLEQTSAGVNVPTGIVADSFSGYRRLTDVQIDALAGEIVRQVRLRGPFVSLGHFLNRTLVPLDRDRSTSAVEPGRSEDLSRFGALQAAIDYSGLNISPNGSKSAFRFLNAASDKVTLLTEGTDRPRSDLTGARTTNYADADTYPWSVSSTDLNPGTVAGTPADKPMLLDERFKPEQGYRSTGIPGWLTQADLLQAIGPALTARSDTFTLRAYGESVNPATGKATSKAWCEAIVQRVPEYADQANTPIQRDPADPAQPKVLTTTNQRFGRQFQVLSFRWLAPNEI